MPQGIVLPGPQLEARDGIQGREFSQVPASLKWQCPIPASVYSGLCCLRLHNFGLQF